LDGEDFTLALSPSDVYSVGSFEGEDWETFSGVAATRFDAEGNLYIFDRGNYRVVVVDRAGEFVREFGRQGDGPGELSSPMSMSLLPDGNVAIFDIGHRAFLIFDSQGEYLRSSPVDLMQGIPGAAVRTLPDGSVISGGGGQIRIAAGPGGGAQNEPTGRPITRFALDEEGSREDIYRAWELPAPDETTQSLSAGGGRMSFRMGRQRAFEPGLSVEVLPDGRLAVVDSVGYRVRLLSPDGSVSGVLERPVSPTLVTDQIRDAEKERQIEQLMEGGGPQVRMRMIGSGGGGAQDVGQDAIRDMMRSRVEEMIFADQIPVIERMAADWSGRLWIQRASGVIGEQGPTDVITAERAYLGTIPADGLRIPAAFGPDGLVAYIETDELDVPSVVVRQLPADWR
jgi:hypothetical protein